MPLLANGNTLFCNCISGILNIGLGLEPRGACMAYNIKGYKPSH